MAERKLPKDMETPPEIRSSFAEKMIVETREYKLITPLFGGGVEPNTPDPVTVIRATEIRGQLRFWWRATRGGQFATIEELKKAEDAIWGAAAKFDEKGKVISGSSKVNIKMINSSKGSEIKPYRIARNKKGELQAFKNKDDIPEYAVFPLKPTKEAIEACGMNTPIASLFNDVSFTIVLTYPNDISDDIKAALWAWETFGGIGARTRRGFGALKRLCSDSELPPSTLSEFSKWLSENSNTYIKNDFSIDDVPMLSNNPFFSIISAKDNPIYIWKILSDKLKSFRSRKDEIPFRKRDIETLRQLFRNNNYKTNITNFQRAYLGLPIAYQNLKKVYRSEENIEKATLRGKQQQRLASPVILRPIACRDGKFIGIALKLMNTNLPKELTIDDYGFSIPTQIQNAPDVISAFIQFVRSNNND